MKTFKEFFSQPEFHDQFHVDDWEYFVVFYEDNSKGLFIHHFIGYEKEPSFDDIKFNQLEMVDHPEFGAGKKALDWKIKLLNQSEMKTLLEIMDDK